MACHFNGDRCHDARALEEKETKMMNYSDVQVLPLRIPCDVIDCENQGKTKYFFLRKIKYKYGEMQEWKTGIAGSCFVCQKHYDEFKKDGSLNDRYVTGETK